MAYSPKSQKKYNEKCTHVGLKLVPASDADLIEYLGTVPSKQGTIKKALRLMIAQEQEREYTPVETTGFNNPDQPPQPDITDETPEPPNFQETADGAEG